MSMEKSFDKSNDDDDDVERDIFVMKEIEMYQVEYRSTIHSCGGEIGKQCILMQQ